MRFAIVAVVVTACGSAPPVPQPITTATVAPELPHIAIAEVVRGARIPHPESVFVEPELILLESVILWRAVPLATKPALARALAKLASAVARVPPPPPSAREALHAKLAANRPSLTTDGALQLAFLVRERVREAHERAVEAWLPARSGPEPQLDHGETFSTLDLVFAGKPAPLVHAVALYLKADALTDLEDPIHDATAVATWLELVTRFPDVQRVTEASYSRIARLAIAGLPDAQAHAIPANRWLAANASRPAARTSADYRLGRLYDAERDRQQARTHYCRAAADATGGFVDQATARLAGGFLDSDLEPLRAACRTATCPCVADVLRELIRELVQTEDDARAREVIELALEAKSSPHDRARWSCDLIQIHERAGGPQAAERAKLPADTRCEEVTRTRDSAASIHRYVETSPGIERCLDDRMARGQWRAAKLRLELVTGADGRVERSTTVDSTFDPETATCIERTVARHRFVGIARTTIAIPLRFEPP